jgi:DNA-binding NarL/FixJ family response regulator
MSKCAPFDQLLESVCAVVAGAQRHRPRRPPPAAPQQRLAAPVTSFDWLTARESAVLAMLMDGQSVARISAAWYVSEATVRTQVRAVLQKLGVNSQLEAVALATRAGWSLMAATSAQSARPHRSLRARATTPRASRRVVSGPSVSPPS